jgi:hypothetical protein
LERDVQKKVIDHAKKVGFRPFKRMMFAGYGRSGDPDFEFNGPGRWTFFIEFKATGETSSDLQLRRQQELRDLGFNVYVVDDSVVGKRIVDREWEWCMGRPARRRRLGT